MPSLVLTVLAAGTEKGLDGGAQAGFIDRWVWRRTRNSRARGVSGALTLLLSHGYGEVTCL